MPSELAGNATEDQATLSRRVKVRMNEALMHFYRGELEPAEALATEVYDQALPAAMTEEACRAQRCRAQIAIEQGAFSRAEQLLEEALQLALANGDRRLIAGCYYARSRKEALRGQYGDVESSVGLTLMHAREVGSFLYEAHAYSLLGHCRGCLGRPEEARDYYQAATDIYRQLIDESHLLFSLLELALVQFELGDTVASRTAFDEALTLTFCPNYSQDIAGGYYRLAYFESQLGRVEVAAGLLEQGRATFDGQLDQQSELSRLMAWASYLAASGQAESAIENWRQAQAYAQHRQNRFAVAEIRLGLARTLLQLGEFDRASAKLQDAQIAFEYFNAEIMLARTICAWGKYHYASGAHAAAQASCDKATHRATGLLAPGVLLRHELQMMRARLTDD